MSTDLIIRDFRDEDAPSLAQMLNESEEGWPGGFTGGVRLTPQALLEKLRGIDAIALLVAETENKIVGYLELTKHWSSENAAYIALINVHPQYRGRGIGTKLIKEALKRCFSAGVDRVDLHTWSGNRAVRLYKRTGFFWVPETSVYMQNYLPQVLKNPIAAKFFEKHPGYLYRFKRDLRAEEDDLKYRGKSVYIYEWEADGDYLKIIVDRYGWSICGVEWSSGLVECIAEERAVKGYPFSVEWRIVNRSKEPFKIVLLPEADTGVKLLEKPPSSLVVNPGEEKVVRSRAVVDLEAEEKPRDEASRRIKSTIVLNGTALTLSTGFEEKPPLEIKVLTHPSYPPLSESTLLLNFLNNFKKKIRGKVSIIAEKGLKVEPREYLLEAEAEEEITLPLKISVVDPNLRKARILVSYDVEGIKAPPKPIYVTVTRPGEAVGYIDRKEKKAVVDMGSYFFKVDFRGLKIEVVRKVDEEPLCFIDGESIGPPFWPSELGRKLYEVELLEDKRIRLVAKAGLKKVPGLELVKVIEVLNPSPLLKISYRLVNTSSLEKELRLRVNMNMNTWEAEKLLVPLRNKVVEYRVIAGDFPGSRGDLPTEPTEYSECWSCYTTRKGELVGVVWSKENVHEVDFSWGRLPRLTYSIKLKPHSATELPPLYLYVGKGSWRNIQSLYRELVERREPEPTTYSKAKPVELRTEPLFLEDTTSSQVDLVLVKHRAKKLKGVIKLRSKTLKITPSEVTVESLEDKVLRKKLALEALIKDVFCHYINYELYSNYGVIRGKIPLIVLSRGGEVSVKVSNSKAVVDNGLLVMKIDAEFAGALYELVDKRTNANNLFSSYPKPRPFLWYNPWFGGVRLRRGFGRDYLWKEKWLIQEASIGSWRGVKVYTKISHEKNKVLKGITLEQYYLTVPNSSIVLLYTKVVNTSRRYFDRELLLTLFTSPGGKHGTGAIVPYTDEIYEKTVYEHEIAYPATSREYVVVYNETAALALVKPERRDIVLGAAVGEEKTCSLYVAMSPLDYIKPGESYSFYVFLVLAKNKEEAETYKVLSKIKY